MARPKKTHDSGSAAISDLFRQGLLEWNRQENRREMPWKGEKDPYKVWLSEVILQQTRVEQGLGYYERFIKAYPAIGDLATAPDHEVFKLWEGLGYYSRCRNLLATAREIHEKGKFPDTYEGLLALKGIGPYTAAAIASFAFHLPFAVLDGNVFRVLARVFLVEKPVDSTEGRKLFVQLAQQVLPDDKPATYNQAIMDFGATVCKPVPLCSRCFFNEHCLAYKADKVSLLPMKEKKLVIRDRYFHYFLITWEDKVLLRERLTKDIWQHLHEPLLIETAKKLNRSQLLTHLGKTFQISPEDGHISKSILEKSQRLTHQLVHFSFVNMVLDKPLQVAGYSWVTINESKKLAFPKAIREVVTAHLRELAGNKFDE